MIKLLKNKNEELVITIIVILVIIITCLSYCNVKSSKKVDESIALYNSITDTLKTTLNSKGELEYKINVITTEKVDAFIKLKVNDATINSLQQRVKYYKDKLTTGSSVTIANINTHVDTVFLTDTVIDLSGLEFTCDTPTYITNLDNKFEGWITGNITSCYDTTKITLDIKNDFSILIGKENGEIKAILSDMNPYTKTDNLRVYQVSNLKPRKGKNLIIGGVIGAALTYLIIR